MHNTRKTVVTNKRKSIKKRICQKTKKWIMNFIIKTMRLNEKESMLEFLYRARMDNAIEQAVKKDKKYQEVNEKAHIKIDKINRIRFNSEQWKLVDEALSVNNEICLEYGRVTYYQGVKDTISLLTELYSSLQLI